MLMLVTKKGMSSSPWNRKMSNKRNPIIDPNQTIVYQIRTQKSFESSMDGLVCGTDHHAGRGWQYAPDWHSDRSGRVAWIAQKSARSGNAIDLGQFVLIPIRQMRQLSNLYWAQTIKKKITHE